MPERDTTAALLTIAREGFIEIGYSDNLLREEYSFADVFVSDQLLRRVELAAFAQEPPSYRNACFGIVVPSSSGPEAIMEYRALGAPRIFALHAQEEKVYHWQVRAQEKPVFIESIDPAHLRNLILAHRDEWNPEHVFRAKSIRFMSGPTQLDFFDVGLIPTLEDHVHEKLGRLLNNVIASCEAAYKEHHNDPINYKALFRLIFRLVASKMLADRQYKEKWLSNNAQEVIKDIENFYFQHTPPKPVLNDTYIQNIAWQKIRDAFSFRNLSVESLAYVYENTLVDREKRKKYGIHATPPRIAEYIVQLLPFEELAQNERRVFEPFCGHAPFLTAAIGRLRALLPPDTDARQRHDYLVRMLTGMEIDSLACEVALNCLIETDFPNPNGWRIENTDAFKTPDWESYLSQANIVLCNPPYEAILADDRRQNASIVSANKAVEALRRILLDPPKMLGVVLPRVFIRGQSYREIRKQIDIIYNNVTLVELPDNAFNYSDAETVLLITHGQRNTQPVRRVFQVEKKDYKQFLYTGKPTREFADANVEISTSSDFAHNQLQNIWHALAHLPSLENIAEVHLGIRYKVPFKEHEAELISETPRAGFFKGLVSVETNDFEPYNIHHTSYLNMDTKKMYREAYKLPWEKPKIIANAGRKSRGPWTIMAAIDEQGLVCYQNFHGIWPKGNLPLEAIAALLNSSIANAFLSTRQGKRHNQIQIIKQIPIPELRPAQIHLITSLVREYTNLRSQWLTEPEHSEYFEKRCRGLVNRIDGEILNAYNLGLNLEQELITYFAGQKRSGPVALTQVDLSPTKRFYTSLIKVEDIRNEHESKVVDAMIMNWNPHQIVHLPITLIPESIQQRLDRDTWLLAEVTIGARTTDALSFRDIQLAPELDPEDELA